MAIFVQKYQTEIFFSFQIAFLNKIKYPSPLCTASQQHQMVARRKVCLRKNNNSHRYQLNAGIFSTQLPNVCVHWYIVHTYIIETFQDFLIKLGIKPLKHLLEISIFTLNNDLVRLTKIMNNLVKDLKILSFKVIFTVCKKV